MNVFRSLILPPLGWALCVLVLPLVLYHRFKAGRPQGRPRLFWGTTSIVSMAMNAAALRDKGYLSKAVALANPGFKVPPGFDIVIEETASETFWTSRVVGTARAFMLFYRALNDYDVFHFFFNGGILRKTPLALMEPWLLRLAGKKVIIFPYGSDAFAPSRITYLSWRGALLLDYPGLGAKNDETIKRIDRYCRDADLIVGCLVHLITLPKWDALMLTCFPVETDQLEPVYPKEDTQSGTGILRIFHAPNHRGVKGTQYLIDAVDRLQSEGLAIELDMVEGRPRSEVLSRMKRADLIVDQLHFGYGLTALEAMALGKMVISGKNPDEHDQLFDAHGLKDCPILWSSPGT